ncbi:MAG: Mur ligase domain-containing protein, partial [Chitinophagales bacterium]
MKTVYFIGIGGIGMSALARYFKLMGATVSGYDKTPTRLTKQLQTEGINIHFEEDVEAIPKQVDLIVYTPAIPKDHAELVYLREQGYELKKRAAVLGEITKGYFTIAVAGTHGKTTVSSMITHLLKHTGYDCTAFVGGIMRNFESNF